MDKSIIFFDGVCNLCNDFVQFVIRRDRHNRFMFSSLQSRQAMELLKEETYPAESKTIILLEDKKIYKRSTAVLRILRRLQGIWPLTYALMIVPAFLRNRVYDLIAHNRYKWFGTRDECMRPTPELKEKFLTYGNQ